MIILRTRGGLGNQFFQYAAARSLAQSVGAALAFDGEWHRRHGLRFDRPFYLAHYRVRGAVSKPPFLMTCSNRLGGTVGRVLGRFAIALAGYQFFESNVIGFDPAFNRLGKRCIIEGDFQSPLYFNGIDSALKNELVLNSPLPERWMKEVGRIRSQVSVCIQVRRSDYITHPGARAVHGLCDREYFVRAWQHLLSCVPEANGYVFSDDHVWARSMFSDWRNVTIVGSEWDGPHYLYKFELMKSCRHFIIANSTFGWWAAWLGSSRESTVIVPQRWYANATVEECGLMIPSWIAM